MNRLRIGFAICAMTLLAIAPAGAQSDSDDPPAPAASPFEPAPLAEDPVGATDQPFKRLFPNLFSDLRRLPSKDSALVLGIGAVMSLAVHPMDVSATEHASAGGTNQIFAVGGIAGSGYTQAGGALVTYAIGRITKHAATSHVGADLIRVQALAGLVTHGMKIAARRARPGGAPGHLPATYSFPSGHAYSTWASATVVWRDLGWKFGVPAAVLAAYVSGSRVQQNQHFPSDVLFGAALGVASGRTVTVGHGGRTLLVSAAPVRGGVAAVFTLVER